MKPASRISPRMHRARKAAARDKLRLISPTVRRRKKDANAFAGYVMFLALRDVGPDPRYLNRSHVGRHDEAFAYWRARMREWFKEHAPSMRPAI